MQTKTGLWLEARSASFCGQVLCGLAVAVLLGCGKSSPPKAAAAPPPPVVAPVASGDAPQSAPAPAAAATGGFATPGQAAEPTTVIDGELFALAGPPAEGTLYETGKPLTASPRDRYQARNLGANASSSSFQVQGPILGTRVPPSSPSPDAKDKVEIPAGFVALKEFGDSPDRWPWRLRCEKDESVMVFVPAGTFMQGSEMGPPECRPEHGVFLDGFYIDMHEVTSAQYEKYRESARQAKRRTQDPARKAAAPGEPVTGINCGDANIYANWVGKKLPTEAQWEKAARGPNGLQHAWGNDKPLWTRPRFPGQIDLVGTFPHDVSPYNVYDMAGNAREWCADWYAEDYYQTVLSRSDSIPRNPMGPKISNRQSMRVVKGGQPAWFAWARSGVMYTDRPLDIGFRCVLTLERPERPEKKDKTAKSTEP